MKRLSFLKPALAVAFAALSTWPGPAAPGADAKFEALADEFITGYLAWRPEAGVQLGLHEYDGRVTDLSRASIDAERARLRRFEQALEALPVTALGARARHDARLLLTAIRNELFKFEDLEAHVRNPMTYAGVIDVNIYTKRDFAPLEERMRSILAIERQAPTVMAAARANLAERLARPFIETAVRIANGAADFLEKDLPGVLKDVTNQTLQAEFRAVHPQAVAALRGYAAWLEKEKLPRAHSDFALGRDKYVKLLRASELISTPPEQLLELGWRELQREQARFAEAARQIDPTRKPIEVFQAIQKDHPTEASLIPDTKKNLEAIRQFLVEHRIITLPSEVRARVEEMPRHLRATGFASMDTPGPFETRATEAYYYVTPTEPDWTPQEKEQWLTAFNYYTTDVVSIHEAYPGHYTQFLCLNASPANRLEKIFGSYAFIEGWAHYTEQMMLDEGFGAKGPLGGDPVRAAKYRLAQSDEALLRLCRLCVSIRMHCQGMTLEDGTKFFEDHCYYERKPAYQEALRGTYDAPYLYYTLGKLAVLKLREDYRKQEGRRYSLQRFHDEMLRHGAPPFRLLREVMLKDRARWEEVF